VEAALARAVDLLHGARRPLLHGFDGATVEDVRAAVALADRLGALLAVGDAAGPWPGAPAIPLRGACTATLGEIRDRSRLIVIWREDPEVTHPRLLGRLGLADQTPSRGPAERTLVVVDDRDTATARRTGSRLRWAAERDLEALVTLHALHRGVASPAADLAQPLGELLERIAAAPHVAFLFGTGLTGGAGGQRRALALHELVRALSHDRHVVTLELGGAAGTRGAEDALAWQTGYGGAVDLAAGHPELATATEPLVTAEHVDVALRIEGAPGRPAAGVAEIALAAGPASPDVAVSIRTAAAGVQAGGTAHRLDGVPLALQAAAAGEGPTAAALLTRLLAEVER
jgi:formylmethanofuran dehydrogenase subunit B